MSVHKFRLGWHACDKMAANRATNSIFFPGAFAPQFWGVLFSTPLFFEFWARGKCTQTPPSDTITTKLIAPFKNDLPASNIDGFRRVCADHKNAFYDPSIKETGHSLSLSCQCVPLPETSYKVPWAFIISKNSSYKSLINWR